MIGKLISPGDKLEMKSVVNVLLPDGTEGVKTYKTSVYDILADGKIQIVMPIDKQKLVLLPVDGEYDVCFFSNGGMYKANVRIVDRQKINNTYIVVAEMITNLHKYQRREYYRFNCIIDMSVREMTEQEVSGFRNGMSALVEDAEMEKAVIVDISGGGLRFVSQRPYQADGMLLMDFSLPVLGVEKNFFVAAKVIYSEKIERREKEYENRVKFEFMRNSTREEIIKYIFDAERKNRKNGKG